jgi:carboxypeptidase T
MKKNLYPTLTLMKSAKLLSLLLFLSIFSNSYSQEKYSTVKIKAPLNDSRKFGELVGQLELDHFNYDEDGDLIAEIGQKELAALRRSGYSFKVVVDDVQAYLKQENDRYFAQRAAGDIQPDRMAMDGVCKTANAIIQTPAAFQVKTTFGGYYSYAEMVTAMDVLVASYPGIAQKISLGFSAQNREIFAVKISDGVTSDDATEPDVLYMGLQHAREAIGGSSMIFFMQYLCESYGADSRIKSLVDAREFYIIPCVNPDGWEYNRLNGGAGSGWRKNRRLITGTTYGVDLNRNYGVDWGTCSTVTCGSASSCGSSSPSSDTYYGPSAFSEPETKAVRDLCYAKNFVAAIDQHCYGPYYSLPYGKTARTLTAIEKKFFSYVPALMGQYNGMRAGNSCESVGYEVAGGVKDWWLIGDIGIGNKGKIWGMTGEGGAGGGIGGTYSSFWAPASQIVNLCKGMTFQNLQLAYAAGSYADIQDESDIAPTALTGTFNFKLTRVGLEDKPITVSLVPLENIESAGTPVTINSLPNYQDTYSGGISYNLFSTLPTGQRIKFAWKIETGDYVYYDTVTKYYNPVTIFQDDMEGTSLTGKWSVVGGWNYATNTAYQGTKSLTESPTGNYPASVSTTKRMATYAGPTINLSGAKAAWVSFWVKHRSENFRDILNVEVSTNGSTWVPICGTTTVQEPGTLDGSKLAGKPALTGIREIWTRELFDLSAYVNTSNLRFRFRFTSDGNTTGFKYQVDDGFSIDNFKIIKTNTTFSNLMPLGSITLNGRLLNDETVKIDWDATELADHDYYEIEKSTNGSYFTPIGKVDGIAPYYFVDKNPVEGNNFYRIRNYTKNGTQKNTNPINVVYNKKGVGLSIYPNPVRDVLNIELNRNLNTKITVIVTDITGRTYLRKQYDMSGQNNMIRIDASSWNRQQYIVKVISDNGETMAIQKFIK